MNKLRETLTSQQDVIESLRSQITSWKEQNNQLHSQLKSIGNLEQQLAVAKLREASAIRAHSEEQAMAVRMQQDRDEWKAKHEETFAFYEDERKQLASMRIERDAALSAVQKASELIKGFFLDDDYDAYGCLREVSEILSADPSAALAERDRAVEKRTAARCAEISDGLEYGPHAAEDIRREFGLEPKTEGE